METITANFTSPIAARQAAARLAQMSAVHHLYHYHRPESGRLLVRPYSTDLTTGGTSGLLAGLVAGLLTTASYWFRFPYSTLVGALVIFIIVALAGLFIGLISGIASQPTLLQPDTVPNQPGDTLKLMVKPGQAAEVEAELRRLQLISSR